MMHMVPRENRRVTCKQPTPHHKTTYRALAGIKQLGLLWRNLDNLNQPVASRGKRIWKPSAVCDWLDGAIQAHAAGSTDKF